MNLDCGFAEEVEDQVGIDDEDSVSILPKLSMAGNPTEHRLAFQQPDRTIDSVHERFGSGRTVLRDEVEYSDEVVLSDREVTELVLSGHVPVGEVLRSSAGG